jgi:hypothetical protein
LDEPQRWVEWFMILNGVIVVGLVLTALVKALSPATGDDPGAARGPIGGKGRDDELA